MSAFLDQLAGKALGIAPAGAAHPALPSRFAGPRSLIAEKPAELYGAAASAPSPAASAPPALQITAVRQSELPGEGSPARHHALPDGKRASQAAPAEEVAWPLSAEARRVVETEAPIGSPLPRAAADRSRQPPAASSAPSHHTGPDPVASRERPLTSSVAMPAAVQAPLMLGRAPAAPARATSEPLTEAAVAGRVRAASAEAPIIHVTIDRIDVRAPAAPKPAVQERRQRLRPSVSLSDYLGGGRAGGRP